MEAKAAKKGSAVPFHVFLARAMDHAQVKNVELAEALGYPRPNVISMMCNGTMKVPTNKFMTIARVLKLDPIAVLQAGLGEYDPGLWETLKGFLGDRLVTKNELALLEVIRSQLKGLDVDLVKSDTFVMAISALIGRMLEKEVQDELRPDPEVKVRDSKTAKLNQQMNALLSKQAKEREKLYSQLVEELDIGTDHRRAA